MKDEDPFIKISVHLLENEKVMSLRPPAFRLYMLGLVSSGRNLTDGLLKVWPMLREASANVRSKNALVEAGLWHEFGHSCERCPNPPAPTGALEYVVIHDYLRYQQSRADVQKRRAVKSKAGKAGAIARWRQSDEDETLDGMADEIAPAIPHVNGRRNGTPMAERWPEPEPEVVPAQSPNQARVLPLYPPDF